MSQTSVEDARDFINSSAWMNIVKAVTDEARQHRNMLMTSLNMPDYMRIASITKLATYQYLFTLLYEEAGSKLPALFKEQFTGTN